MNEPDEENVEEGERKKERMGEGGWKALELEFLEAA